MGNGDMDNTQNITIQPCPFCGYDDVEIDEINMAVYAVICPDCECIGPAIRESLEHAVDEWNKRAGKPS